TGLASVGVCPISRQASHGLQTARAVGTAQSEETVPCSESTPHSDIPSTYAVRSQRALSAFGPDDSSQYLLRPIRARLAHVLPWFAPTVQGVNRLLAHDPPGVSVLVSEPHQGDWWHHFL